MQGTRLLVINDYASNIRRLGKLISILDVKSDEVGMVYRKIQHTTSADLSNKVNTYLQGLSKAKGVTETSGGLTILNEDRLNMLVLIGPKRTLRDAQAFIV